MAESLISITPALCVIIPTYDAAAHLPKLLSQLKTADRVVISDGGSSDHTIKFAIKDGANIALGAKGRGQQLALGARWAAGADWLLFIHADNQLPDGWREAAQKHIQSHSDAAGYFRYRANAKGFWPRFMDFWVGMRNFWWGLPYGDQGLLIPRDMYEALGGYKPIALFEDVDIIDRIKAKFGRRRLRPLKGHMIIDISKYEKHGIWKTGQRNLRLLKAYRNGADIDALLQDYRS